LPLGGDELLVLQEMMMTFSFWGLLHLESSFAVLILCLFFFFFFFFLFSVYLTSQSPKEHETEGLRAALVQ